jgi:protein O-GlcNAc transferase
MNHVQSLIDSAKRCHQAGDLPQAERLYRQVFLEDPNHADVLYYLGTVLLARGNPEEAETVLRSAIQLRPEWPEALNNLAVVLARRKLFGEAAGALRRALQVRPDWDELWRNLGNILKEWGDLDGAVEAHARLVELHPADPEAHNLLGTALAVEGRFDQAVRHFEEALRLEPRYAVAHSNLAFALNFDPHIDSGRLYAEHLFWDRLHGQGLTPRPIHQNDHNPDRRLRVGYVSPDFRTHAVSYFIEPILASHDPEQVEVFAYAELSASDETTSHVRSLVHGWRDTGRLTDADAAQQVRSDGIDILVDLAGHTARNRLGVFTHRPAPVQMTYLGYQNTTGLSTIDYRLTDSIADPSGEPQWYAEELLRLPGAFFCFAPPKTAPSVNGLPARATGTVTFGSLHNLIKLNAEVLRLWSEILRAVPSSRLLIFRHTLRGTGTRKRILQEFQDHGISGDRIRLEHDASPYDGYLGVYGQVDILLDSFPVGGHTITCEAIWMGVPVVTLCGSRYAGRMSSSVLRHLGLDDWVASTPGQYVAAAVRAATDLDRLAALRQGLRERMRDSPLCNRVTFTRQLEDAYRRMWRRWCG